MNNPLAGTDPTGYAACGSVSATEQGSGSCTQDGKEYEYSVGANGDVSLSGGKASDFLSLANSIDGGNSSWKVMSFAGSRNGASGTSNGSANPTQVSGSMGANQGPEQIGSANTVGNTSSTTGRQNFAGKMTPEKVQVTPIVLPKHSYVARINLLLVPNNSVGFEDVYIPEGYEKRIERELASTIDGRYTINGEEIDFRTEVTFNGGAESFTIVLGRVNAGGVFNGVFRDGPGRAQVQPYQFRDGRQLMGFMRLYNDEIRPEVIPHEFGHVLGLIDRYDETTQLPLPGFEKNLMGRVCCGNRLTPADIEQVLRLHAEGKLIGGFRIEREY